MEEFLESIDFSGRRRDDEILENIDVIGRRRPGSSPEDGERLESIDVVGRRRKAAPNDPKHLYYPHELSDPNSMYKNAIRFVAYAQARSFIDSPGDTKSYREIPEQYRNADTRSFPISTRAFATSFGFRNSLVNGLPYIGGSVGNLFEDLVGIGRTGFDYFMNGEKTNYGRRTLELEQSITLYMPDMLINTDKHDYQPISINQASGRAGLYTAGMPVALGGTGSPLGRTEVLAELAGRAGIFGQRSTEAIIAGLGYAMNPMLEMSFGGTQARSFTFQFKFAPRNMKEAEDVIRIIKMLRFHSHSESAGSNDDPTSQGSGTRYLVPPNHFEIQFLRKKQGRYEENLAMPRITTCMLAQVTTNYAAQVESFATFQDGNPVSISVDLEFVESAILTKKDIQKGY